MRRGYTLLELVLVLTLFATLVALAFAEYGAVAQSTAITAGASLVRDVLAEGHADAVTHNTTIEVRIYSLPPDPDSPPTYCALQLHWLNSDGTTPPANHLSLLPAAVVIDATPTHSSLIAANKQLPNPDPGDTHLNSDTRVFHFLPDGSTDLDPSTKWLLTVRAATRSDPAHFPANWAAIAIDPTTGRPQIYRP
jgi:uncharacterized protein (TIGR02596 family)